MQSANEALRFNRNPNLFLKNAGDIARAYIMAGRKLVLLVLVLAVLACAADARHRRRLRSGSNRRTDFDFFFLVRQWPATFCNDHSCTHQPPKKYAFTVHGMWPQRRDGTWPEFCDPSSHVHVDDLDDILDELEEAWPSWFSSDEQFWDHEWSRHGTCAAPVTGDQHRFFKTVLALHDQLNIQDALNAAGIRPSNSRRYPVQDIKNAIEDKYGVMPHVTCDGKGELSEVWMCINKKLKPIDCVEDPRPPHIIASKAAAAAAAGQHTSDEHATSAPVPPNYNCNMVTIPKLQRHWGKQPGFDAVLPAGPNTAQLTWLDIMQPAAGDAHSHHHKHQHHKHDHQHQAQIQQHEAEEEEYVYEPGAGAAADAAAHLTAALQHLEASATIAVQPLVESAADAVQPLVESAASSVLPLMESAANAVQPLMEYAANAMQLLLGGDAPAPAVTESAAGTAAVDGDAAQTSSLAASLAAFEQAAVDAVAGFVETAGDAAAAASGDASAGVVEGAAASGAGVQLDAPVVPAPQAGSTASSDDAELPQQAPKPVVAAVSTAAAPAVAVPGTTAALVAVAEKLQQAQPVQPEPLISGTAIPISAVLAPAVAVVNVKQQQRPAASPNQHLPLLAGVVVAVVAAAVVAAAVAVRAAPVVAEVKARAQGYVPPPGLSPVPHEPEATPLLNTC